MGERMRFILLSTIVVIQLLVLGGCAERGYRLHVNAKSKTVTAESVSSVSAPEKPGLFEKMINAVKQGLSELHHDTQKESSGPKAQTAKEQQHFHARIKSSMELDESASAEEPDEMGEQPVYEESTQESTTEESNTASIDDGSEAYEGHPESQAVDTDVQKRANPEHDLDDRSDVEKVAETLKAKIEAEKKANIEVAEEPIMLLPEHKKQTDKSRQETKNELPKKVASKDRKKSTDESIETTDNTNTQHPIQRIKASTHKKKHSKSYMSNEVALRFIPIDKTYVKFGTSEIHGHVIYMDNGVESPLYKPAAYLVPKSAIANKWYRDYYLKNKTPQKPLTLIYVNKTNLDFDNNFSLYGVEKGDYYIVIAAKDPQNLKRTIYIAKDLHVDRYKKVMAVFSKALK